MRNSAQASLFPKEAPFIPALSDYDWIVVNSSAGKDSQAMLDRVIELAHEQSAATVQPYHIGKAEAAFEDLRRRIVVVHADLGRVEWQGTRQLAEEQASRYNLRFEVVSRHQGDLLTEIESRGMFPGPATRFCTAHHKTNPVSRVFTQLATEARTGDLLSHVEDRGKWPSPRQRYCTSDHKRGPVHRVFTALSKETREGSINRPTRILSCMGLRAEESPARAKRLPFERNEAASNGRRLVDTWLPLHDWTEAQVWERIEMSGVPHHYAYDLGMPRLSCCFCIFAPKAALVLAGKHNPELLAEYVRVEAKIGHTFRVDLSMAQVQAAVNAGEQAGPVTSWKM